MKKAEEISALWTLSKETYFSEQFGEEDIKMMVHNIEQDFPILNGTFIENQQSRLLRNMSWYRKTLKTVIYMLKNQQKMSKKFFDDAEKERKAHKRTIDKMVTLINNHDSEIIEDAIDQDILSRCEVVLIKNDNHLELNARDRDYIHDQLLRQ